MRERSSSPVGGVLGQKPSKTARAKLDAKLRRVNAMTARERMKLALQLGRQLRKLEPYAKP